MIAQAERNGNKMACPFFLHCRGAASTERKYILYVPRPPWMRHEKPLQVSMEMYKIICIFDKTRVHAKIGGYMHPINPKTNV